MFGAAKKLVVELQTLKMDKVASNEANDRGGKPDLSLLQKTSEAKLTGKDTTTSAKRPHVIIQEDPPKRRSARIREKQRGKAVGKAPDNWEEVLDNFREMRKDFNARVDSMGCRKCLDDRAPEKVKRYQVLVSLILSSQNRNGTMQAAMKRLVEHGCTVDNILDMSDEALGELIQPVRFWKGKVVYIKKISAILKENFNSDIPRTVERLRELPGLGRKLTPICMESAWNDVICIRVDAHVHRISNRLGWVKTKTHEETRKALESWLPREVWGEIHVLLVGFGQQTCLPVNPDCSGCLNESLCPFGQATKPEEETAQTFFSDRF